MNQPLLRNLDEMKIVGIGGRFISVLSPEHTNMAVIPRLWDEYGKRSEEIPERVRPNRALGVVLGLPESESPHELYYIAAAEVDSLDTIPEGMEGRLLPGATYAVFTHRGEIGRIGESYHFIYGEWLPASDYQRTTGPEFELYDERFRHDAGDSEVDIYIPVARKQV